MHTPTARQMRRTPILGEFLGSMNLAITLLVAIAVAMVIGTVLQQNQPYQDYLIKFGPFWFEVFDSLGLYNVYGAAWFIGILTFLVISTSVCIYRNTPGMLREMRNYRLHVQRKSLRAFHLQREWHVDGEPQDLQAALGGWLRAQGYRYRVGVGDDHHLLAAMKGRFNRLGYFFTHGAIVVICVGALFDGNLPLVLREASGQLKPETRDLPVTDVPAISRLPVENPSFRGSVSIPEGSSANVVFLQMRDGYLVQPLPFSIEVSDFRTEHYASGQPKSFESDLVITDPALEAPVEKTISVNHPWIYKGYAIYQASFADGGSGLTLEAWPLQSPLTGPEPFEGRVGESLAVKAPDGDMRLEFDDFRLFNINTVEDGEGGQAQKNFGPSFTYKLRDAQGQALEYENYMSPVEFDGRRYLLSGVRASPAEPFRYLHIPVDPKGGVERFQKYNAMLYDNERVEAIAERTTEAGLAAAGADRPQVGAQVAASMRQLVALYREGGFDAVAAMVERNVPEDKREEVAQVYFRVLQTILGELYLELLREEGVNEAEGLSADDGLFLDEALAAISALGSYDSPFYLQLTAFEFVQASGLQIARAPGKNVVYLGFALLTAGVFLMFYVPNRRLWFWIDRDKGFTRVLAAGTGNRHQHDFKEEFDSLCEQLDARWNNR